jgi:hypothetical protein
MSALWIAVISAFAGGMATYLLGLSAQSQASFRNQATAIGAVREEFEAAQRLIVSAKKAKGLWLPPSSLPGDAWQAHGWQLGSFLDDEDLAKIRTARELMVSIDRSVKRLQAKAKKADQQAVVPEEIVTRIERLEARLKEALAILDRTRGDAKSELRRTRRVSRSAVVVILVAVAITAALPTARQVFDGPAVTDSSIAKQLQAELPRSNRAICDESTVFDGAFRCAVDFGGCKGQLEAATGQPSCPVPKQSLWNVFADEECFEAHEIALIEAGAPASQPPGEPKREDLRAGCIDD